MMHVARMLVLGGGDFVVVRNEIECSPSRMSKANTSKLKVTSSLETGVQYSLLRRSDNNLPVFFGSGYSSGSIPMS